MKYLLRKAQYNGLSLELKKKKSDFRFELKGKLGEGKLEYGGYPSQKWCVFGSKKFARSFIAFLKERCEGYSYGFYKRMYLQGIGYRVWTKGRRLLFQIGYNHLIKFSLPEGMYAYGKKYRFVLFGLSKEEVNRMAQRLIWLRVPDSYKGKGVRYEEKFFVLKKSKDAKKG